MDRDEAQFILRAYRPNSDDAHDPQFEEALALTKQDPELARWFAEEQALDAAFGRKIRAAIPVPPDLKRQLLLARSTGRSAPWWRRRSWLALAACLSLTLGSAELVWRHVRSERQLEQFRTAMVHAALDTAHHNDVEGLDEPARRHWLATQGATAEMSVPASLARSDVMGCKVVDWRDARVTMLCYNCDGAHADLFVVDEARVPGLATSAQPRFAAAGAASTATWRRDGKVYLLVANQPVNSLQRLLTI